MEFYIKKTNIYLSFKEILALARCRQWATLTFTQMVDGYSPVAVTIAYLSLSTNSRSQFGKHYCAVTIGLGKYSGTPWSPPVKRLPTSAPITIPFEK